MARPLHVFRGWLAVIAAGAVLLTLGGQSLPIVNATTSAGPRAIYEPLPPARILDTRTTGSAIAGGAANARLVQVTGLGGVPVDATAVVANVTATQSTANSYLTVYPNGQSPPQVSNLNFLKGQIVPNLVTVKLGDGGAVRILNYTGAVHVIVDVAGYYRGHDHDDRYFTKPETQARTAPNALSCNAGEFLRSVAADGTPTCVTPARPTSPFLGEPGGVSLVIPAGTTNTLTNDSYYENVTVDTNAVINTNGYRLFVRGTLTLANGSRISRNGNPGTLNAAGAALAPGTLGGGGAATCSVPSPQITNSLGGRGNNGGSAGGEAIPPIANVGGTGIVKSVQTALLGRTLDGALVNGGGGGGGNTCPSTTVGGGGSGGGVVVVAAGAIVVSSGTATISADGGASEKGGGGGGGVVIVASANAKPAALVIRASGGVSGGSVAFNGVAGTTIFLSL